MNTEYFDAHLTVLQQRWETALRQTQFDSALIAAGLSRTYFLDDQSPPFRVNPHFQQWFPSEACEASMLVIRPGDRPKLFFHKPRDYWHQPPTLPDWAAERFEVRVFDEVSDLIDAALSEAFSGRGHNACITEQPLTNVPADLVNPPRLIDHLHFQRACKTSFEVACMRMATDAAVLGHLAAQALFKTQKSVSEFDINLAYLAAARTTAGELPYSNIVALNEHAGVLHYQHYGRSAPKDQRSFLIDAGTRCAGYASDITRTYSASVDAFGELVERLDVAQLALVDTLRPGMEFLDLHVDMHRRISQVLSEAGLIRCSPVSAFESGITEVFFPHGLGHLIGLQTHDVGGQQSDEKGTLRPPPGNYAALRLTRTLEPGVTVTIEPGLYFIPQLLDGLRSGPLGKEINWPLVESLQPCGGIRIEDNVLITDDGAENLTRAAFAAARGERQDVS